MAGETTHSAAMGMNVSVRQFFRYRADAIAAIAQSIEQILRRPPDSHRHLLQLAKAIETVDPKAAREIYLRIPVGVAGQVAYNIVRTSLWAGLEVTQKQIDACEGPWRLMALAAVSRHLIALGRDQQSQALRAKVRAQLGGGSGALYDTVAFELAAQDVLDAHRRGDVLRAAEITDTLRAIAGANEYLLAFAMTIEAQQHVLEGDNTAAALVLSDLEALDVHRHDHYIMARAAYCHAMLSLVRGYHEDAFAIANGARPAITALEAGFGYRSATIAGRAALLAGLPWTPPADLIQRYPDLWTRAETDGVVARHLLATDNVAARALAESALARAQAHEAELIGTAIKAVIAAALDLDQRPEEAQACWLEVWQNALARGDMFALYDMFVVPHAPVHDVGPLRLDDRFFEVLQAHVESSVPGYTLTRSHDLERASLSLLRACVCAAIGKPEPHAKVIADTRQLGGGLVRAQVADDKARRQGDAAARVVARAAGWLVPPHERQAFRERLMAQWDIALELVQKSMSPQEHRLHA